MTKWVDRIASKKVFVAIIQLLVSAGLITSAMVSHQDRDVLIALVTFMGGPSVVSCGALIGFQGLIDNTIAKNGHTKAVL